MVIPCDGVGRPPDGRIVPRETDDVPVTRRRLLRSVGAGVLASSAIPARTAADPGSDLVRVQNNSSDWCSGTGSIYVENISGVTGEWTDVDVVVAGDAENVPQQFQLEWYNISCDPREGECEPYGEGRVVELTGVTFDNAGQATFTVTATADSRREEEQVTVECPELAQPTPTPEQPSKPGGHGRKTADENAGESGKQGRDKAGAKSGRYPFA